MKYFKVPNQVFDLNLTPIEFCVLCCLLKCNHSVQEIGIIKGRSTAKDDRPFFISVSRSQTSRRS